MNPPRCVLTIAGSDSGAGAGVQADARTIHALGGFAVMAVTAITAQNTRGIREWTAVAPALVQSQLEAVLDDFDVTAIKTGLLPGPAAIRVIAAILSRHPQIPLVIDPVIGSTAGTRFLGPAGIRCLKKELLPRATLLTPNWPEAAVLSGRAVHSAAGALEAGRALAAEARCAVLVKGGHAPGGMCPDCLVQPGAGAVRWFESPRIQSINTHGTGCVLSAAIATELGRGRTLAVAVARAREFLRHGLKRGRRLEWGGNGPALVG